MRIQDSPFIILWYIIMQQFFFKEHPKQILFKERTLPPDQMPDDDKNFINKLINTVVEEKTNEPLLCITKDQSKIDSLKRCFKKVDIHIDNLREYIQEKETELYLNNNITSLKSISRRNFYSGLTYYYEIDGVKLDPKYFTKMNETNKNLIDELEKTLMDHKKFLKEFKEIRKNLLETKCVNGKSDWKNENDIVNFDKNKIPQYVLYNVRGGYKKRKTKKSRKNKRKSYKARR